MNGGYAEIYRSLLKHKLWTQETFTQGQAWVDLLISAEFDDTDVQWKDITIFAERGEFVTSQVHLAKRWKWGRGKVNRFLKMLIDEEMISVFTDNDRLKGYTKIKILNYPPPRNDSPKQTRKTDTGKLLKNSNIEENGGHSEQTQQLVLISPEEYTIDLPELAKKNWNKIAKPSPYLPAYNHQINEELKGIILKCWQNSGLKPSEFLDEVHKLAQFANQDPFCSGRKPSKNHPNFKVTFRFLMKYMGKVQDWTDYIRQGKFNPRPAPTYQQVEQQERDHEKSKRHYSDDARGLVKALTEIDRPEAKVISAFLQAPMKSDPRIPDLERLKEKWTNELRFCNTKAEEAAIMKVLKEIDETIKKIEKDK